MSVIFCEGFDTLSFGEKRTVELSFAIVLEALACCFGTDKFDIDKLMKLLTTEACCFETDKFDIDRLMTYIQKLLTTEESKSLIKTIQSVLEEEWNLEAEMLLQESLTQAEEPGLNQFLSSLPKGKLEPITMNVGSFKRVCDDKPSVADNQNPGLARL